MTRGELRELVLVLLGEKFDSDFSGRVVGELELCAVVLGVAVALLFFGCFLECFGMFVF